MIAAAARQIDSILHPGAEDTGCTEQALRLAEKIVAAAPDINVDRSEYLDRHVDHVAEILHRSVYQSLVLDDTPFTDHQHAATAQVGEQGEQGGASDRGHAATLDGGSASGEMAGGFSLMLQTHKPCLEKASRIGILHRYISI